MLGNLAIPASGKTWTSNPYSFYLGADVYPEKEVLSMRDGGVLQFYDNIRPTNPKVFAEYIISRGKLTEAKGTQAIRYYVLPRLHPALELFIPGLIMLVAGIALYSIYDRRNKKKEPNQAVEPTIIAVTDCAPSSTLRASHDRGSL